ncbi:MAG: hypothetical protein TREMPRED_002162 [Tremellales sp. Tagirdzhanova-0007]|nr:MAG: hypothetical protein TREMPRED_002162 [Tremellales sp. Tagirdzhanova-0007]
MAGKRWWLGDGPPEEGASNVGNNLHVSGLARSIDVRYLDQLFGKYGKVSKAEVMADPHTQESRGFGFVKMETGEDANACIEAINGTTFEGKVITVAHARRGRARTPTPGRYHGVKMDSAPRYGGGYQDRPYQPKSYDSRYADRGPPPRGCEFSAFSLQPDSYVMQTTIGVKMTAAMMIAATTIVAIMDVTGERAVRSLVDIS